MYPLTEAQPFPRRQWWMVAYSSEIGREALGKTILDERVVLYRKENGEAVAVSGICPHRMYPLEHGCLIGDSIQCGYHGITYSPNGQCVSVPSQSGAAPVALRSYPVVERGGTIWMWTGEPELADSALMPDLAAIGLDAPGWVAEQTRYIHLPARFTLLIDNLLDLTHISFVHADTIPAADAVASIPAEAVSGEKTFNLRRIARHIPSNPLLKMFFPDYDGAVDEDFDAEYFGPCLVRTGGGFYATGTGRSLGSMNFVHLMTPETAHSTHYHVIISRNFRTDDSVIAKWCFNSSNEIGPQDQAALTRIEQMLQSGLALPQEVSVRADVGSIQVRKRLSAQIRSESTAIDAVA